MTRLSEMFDTFSGAKMTVEELIAKQTRIERWDPACHASWSLLLHGRSCRRHSRLNS